ncbi:MAG: exopolysaccharide biosynthesis polyprenyl glycosylphosphotransferase [Acidimicrobiales bacterium]
MRVKGNPVRRQLVAGDVVGLGACWLAEALAYPNGELRRQVALGIIASLVTLAVMHRAGLYRSAVCALRSLEAVRVTAASGVGAGAFLVVEAPFQHVHVAGPSEAAAGAVLAVLMLRWRFSRWLKARRSSSEFLRTVVMVGVNDDAGELWVLLSEEPELGYRVGAVTGERHLGAPWGHLPHCANVNQVGDLARRVGASGAIVVASALRPAERKEAVEVALAAGLHVQVWPGLIGLSSRRVRLVPISSVPLLYVEPREVAPWKLVAKRAMDLVGASVLGVLNAPLVALAAVAIKLSDGGPVIYRSERVGHKGATISVLKLRTMVPGAASVDVDALNERTGGPLFKASNDPRVTRVGRFLRAASIDEIPQLWNVLNGTMSLVGPRPALPEEVEHFDPELRRRHEMRPGITGLWQVEARDNPSFSAYRRLDLAYVDDWSLGLDIAIVASTVHHLAVRAFEALSEMVPRRRRRAVEPAGAAGACPPVEGLATRESA